MNIPLALYKDQILSMVQGNYRGNISNSKPLYLLAILDCIDKKLITENKIILDDISIQEAFNHLYTQYNNKKVSGISTLVKPFFHLSSSDFYNLIWRKGTIVPRNANSPTASFLRENLLYAKLDDNLWDLLQIEQNRLDIKKSIINRYLTLK